MPQPARLKARVAEITEHAPGLKTFVLEPERPAPRFKPGQFLHLALDPWDPSQHWPESRAFSIASSPEQRSRLEITVSAVGRITKRMMELKQGAEVWLKLPLGEFVIEAAGGAQTVLVAGGSGITPFASLLRSSPAAAGVPADTRICVLYGARRPELLIHRRTLEEAAARWPGLSWRLYAEEGGADAVVAGRLNGKLALDVAGVAAPMATYFLSGPPQMIAALRSDLAGAGVASERIRVDAWA